MAGIYKRGPVYWGRAQRGGKEYRRSLQTGSKSIAGKRFQAWLDELDAIGWGDQTRRPLNEVGPAFIREHCITLRYSSAKRYRISLDWLLTKLGHKFLDEIGSADIVEFETWRRSAGVSPPTIRRDLACLSSVFSFAIEREWVTANPVGPFLRRAKKRGLRESEARTRYLTHAEEVRLLTACTGIVRSAITIAIYSGLRLEELFGLTWREVDLQARTIRLEAERTKGKRSRTVALLDPAVDALRALPRHLRSPFVIWRGGEGRRIRHLDRGLKAALKRAGLDGVRWHDLRRTHGCRLLQDQGWSMEMVKDQLGHTSVAITERSYAFLEVEQRLARAGTAAPLQEQKTNE
jgi:integrase